MIPLVKTQSTAELDLNTSRLNIQSQKFDGYHFRNKKLDGLSEWMYI